MILNPEETLEVTAKEAYKLLLSDTPPILIDCREKDEYDIAHIRGCILIPMSSLQERFPADISKNSDILVYCHHGLRSLKVTSYLRSAGYLNTYSVIGGIDDWALQIDPSLTRY